MTGLKTVILDKINRYEAVVGVIGLGYVGLPWQWKWRRRAIVPLALMSSGKGRYGKRRAELYRRHCGQYAEGGRGGGHALRNL